MAKIKGTNGDDNLNGFSSNDQIDGKKGNDFISGGDGNDKIKGKQGNDTISGDAGNDKLQGGDGNDTFYGGKGNDSIDGGKGIDTAIYSGNYSNYVITFQGNDKVTVSDTTANRDGTDDLKKVEFLQFNDGFVDLQSHNAYLVNAEIDSSARKPSTHEMINGTGIPSTGFGLVENLDNGIELGWQVIYRQGPTVTTTDDYSDGVLHFSVNDGPQSTTNGSSGNNSAYASWSFDYSIATGLNGANTDLGDFNFKLLIDKDPSAATDYAELHLVHDPIANPAGSGYVWKDASGAINVIADDAGNGDVTQNSQNYKFYPLAGYNAAGGWVGPAHFDLVLQAFDHSNHLLAQNHIVVDVIL